MATNRRGRATRQRILDAGEQILAERGADLTMEEVAAAAGVTRTTVYRHVANHDDLLAAVVLRSSGRLAEQLAAVLDGPGPFAERLTTGIVLTVGLVRDTPHLRAVVALPDAGRRWPVIDRTNAFLDAVWQFFRPRFERAVAVEGVVLRTDVDRTIDWVLRQALLLMLVPSVHGDDDAAVRADVETFVLPAILAG